MASNQTNSRSISPMSVNIILATGIRWLSGYPLLSIRHIFNFSRAEAYNISNIFLKAVLTTDELKINLPQSNSEILKLKEGFHKISKDGVMYGCCAAIDGFFVKTNRPVYWEDCNIRAYYSGHYEHYGLNCQAACDANLKFIYFGVVSPGSTNDNVSYTRTGELKELIENLDEGDYFVGDAAYTLTEHLLTPLTGTQRNNPENDSFNFYLSQKRIRIEMAFGLLVSKFRILKSPLTFRMKKNSQVIMACAMIHNFILENDGTKFSEDTINDTYIDPDDFGHNFEDDSIIEQCSDSPGGNMTYMPTMREEDYTPIEGVSHLRRVFVEWLSEREYSRPDYNLMRNSRIRTMDHATININGTEEIGYCDSFYHPS